MTGIGESTVSIVNEVNQLLKNYGVKLWKNTSKKMKINLTEVFVKWNVSGNLYMHFVRLMAHIYIKKK